MLASQPRRPVAPRSELVNFYGTITDRLPRLSCASSYRVLVPRSRKNLPVVSSISSWVEATAICDNSASCSFGSGRCCRPISELADSPRECLDALAGAATALQNLNAITATIEIALRSLYRHKQIRCFETTVPPVFTAGRDSQGEIDRGFAPLFSFNRHRRSLHSEFGEAMSTTVQRDLPGNSEHSAPTPTNPPIPDDGFSPWSESQNNVASEWARERLPRKVIRVGNW
jgi:hypothetical protein